MLAMAALGGLYYITIMNVQSDDNTNAIDDSNELTVAGKLESAVDEQEKVLKEEKKVLRVITVDFNTLPDGNNPKLKQLDNLNYRLVRLSLVRMLGRTCLKKYIKDTDHTLSETETIYC